MRSIKISKNYYYDYIYYCYCFIVKLLVYNNSSLNQRLQSSFVIVDVPTHLFIQFETCALRLRISISSVGSLITNSVVGFLMHQRALRARANIYLSKQSEFTCYTGLYSVRNVNVLLPPEM